MGAGAFPFHNEAMKTPNASAPSFFQPQNDHGRLSNTNGNAASYAILSESSDLSEADENLPLKKGKKPKSQDSGGYSMSSEDEIKRPSRKNSSNV